MQKEEHYSSQCFSKAVTEVTAADAAPSDTSYDTSYLMPVTEGNSNTSWNTTVIVNGRQLPFKLDTGAEVTVTSDQALQLLNAKELQSSNKRLCGPDNRPLDVVGELSATLIYKERSCTHPVYVVRNLQAEPPWSTGNLVPQPPC